MKEHRGPGRAARAVERRRARRAMIGRLSCACYDAPMPLETQLRDWVQAGLVTEAQAHAIQAFEARRPPAAVAAASAAARPARPRQWALYGIVGLGVLAIGTGLVSLIAANWDAIPAAAKLGVDLAAQTALGVAFARRAARPGLAREALLVALMALALGGIGLVGQVFHLESDGWSGLLLWLGLTVGAALLAESRAPAHFWLAGVALTGGLWADDARVPSEPVRVMLLLALPFLVGAVGFVGLTRASWPPPSFARAARSWSLAAIVGAGSALGSVLWYGQPLAGHGHVRQLRHALPWPWLAALAMAAVVLVARAPAASAEAARHDRRFRVLVAASVLSALLYVTLPVLLPLGRQRVASAVLFLAVWALAGAAAVARERPRLFDLISIVIGVRVLAIYFEVFGSLAATGVGLIVSGLLVLGSAYAWYRWRGRLARALGGT
jgi:uncharacterized membrane protein